MDSRWFLFGAVVGLLILLFDKPLAVQVQQALPFLSPAVPQAGNQKILAGNSTSVVSQSGSCCPSYSAVTAAPVSPSTSVIAPMQSTPVTPRVRLYAGSPAPPVTAPISISPIITGVN